MVKRSPRLLHKTFEILIKNPMIIETEGTRTPINIIVTQNKRAMIGDTTRKSP
jgi:hypothetical protein